MDFSWNQIIGTLRIRVDGELMEKRIILISPLSWSGSPIASSDEKWNVLDSGFEVQLVERWTFDVGKEEKHRIRIEKERARLLAGFRPQRYRIFLDSQFIIEYKGY